MSLIFFLPFGSWILFDGIESESQAGGAGSFSERAEWSGCKADCWLVGSSARLDVI